MKTLKILQLFAKIGFRESVKLLKACLKRWIFSFFQKDNREGATLISRGRAFHSLGAVTEKALSRVPISYA